MTGRRWKAGDGRAPRRHRSRCPRRPARDGAGARGSISPAPWISTARGSRKRRTSAVNLLFQLLEPLVDAGQEHVNLFEILLVLLRGEIEGNEDQRDDRGGKEQQKRQLTLQQGLAQCAVDLVEGKFTRCRKKP